MEKVKIRTAPGMAKVDTAIAGVAVFAFYKGPHLKPLVHLGLEFGHGDLDHRHHVSSVKRIFGCLLLLISSMTLGLWIELQVYIRTIYIT